MLGAIERFIVGWRFPVVVIAVLLFAVMSMVGILLVPPSLGVLSAFAADFKVWCFGYDPATGSLEWGYVWMLTIQPFILLAVIFLLWKKPLLDILRSKPLAILPYVGQGFLIVAALAVTLPLVGNTGVLQETGSGFPAESLRTMREAPAFTVVDQNGNQINLERLRGRVVLVTAVYSSCGDTCPLILQQTKRVLNRLSSAEREDLVVIAVTLDPEIDTPRVMKALLTGHGLDAYGIKAGTGDPETINELLDMYGFQRVKDPDTGMIQHANRLLAIDRAGRIAYTFALGPIQEQWLGEALQLLLSETAPA